MNYKVKIIDIKNISGDVKKIKTEKPGGYNFVSGQHTALSINNPKMKNLKRFFSFSSSNDKDFLEFIVRIHPEKEGFTSELDKLKIGDELIIEDAKGRIKYIGPGIFIAGGVGITPFLSIFSEMSEEIKESELFFMNKTKKGIIFESELKKMFGKRVIFNLTQEENKDYGKGRIDKSFLKKYVKDFNRNFYLCGDFKWVLQLKKDLIELGAKKEKIVSEV